MEGVGARLGRSSRSYGPSTVFTGPVRNWEKKWVHVPPPNSGHNHHPAANGSHGSSHLLLYKWTPIAPSQAKDSSQDDNNGSNGNSANYRSSNRDDGARDDEPQKKKFKYIPIIVLEEQKEEFPEQMEDDTKPIATDPNPAETPSKTEEYDEKPDINEVAQNNAVGRQDLNKSTLDLSLGLNSDDGETEFDSKSRSN